jgi:hypothetical protein
VKRRRRSAQKRAFNWKKLPKIVLLAGGTIGLGWLAVQAAAMEAFGRRNPATAAQFDADDPRLPLARAMIEFRTKAGAVSPQSTRAAVLALADVPLAEEPFLLAGLQALLAGKPDQAAPLLAEARRRNPRSRVTRLLLLDRYLRTRDTENAVAEIAAIGRLIPEANRVLVPELAKLAVKPDSGPAVAEVLRSDPEMRTRVLEHLAQAGTRSNQVLAIAEQSGAPLSGQTAPWQQKLLQKLVDTNDIAGARTLWARFAAVDQQAISGGVYDPRFQRLPGPPPFNWSFASSGAGVAEPTPQQALQVEYYGRADAELASQLLMLAPGRYQIAFRAAGNTPGQSSAVSWRLSCHPGGSEIASVPIQKLTYTAAPRRGEFTVPAGGCPSQWLKLIGTPAEFPAAHSITISDLQVRRAGAS